MAASTAPKVLIYLLRRDLRLSDNPIFHELCRLYRSQSPAFNLVLPIYVFPAYQTEISGFIPDAEDPDATPKSPYPEARSQVAGFWRCGPHRARFLAESVWDVKEKLGQAGSDLLVRVGRPADIVRDALDHFEAAPESNPGKSPAGEDHGEVVGVWMTGEEAFEEKQEEMEIQSLVEERGKEFRIFQDEKYFVDE
jgi:deoxyribodipyrimidine photo-lyase